MCKKGVRILFFIELLNVINCFHLFAASMDSYSLCKKICFVVNDNLRSFKWHKSAKPLCANYHIVGSNAITNTVICISMNRIPVSIVNRLFFFSDTYDLLFGSFSARYILYLPIRSPRLRSQCPRLQYHRVQYPCHSSRRRPSVQPYTLLPSTYRS